jgi:hypothetical protein
MTSGRRATERLSIRLPNAGVPLRVGAWALFLVGVQACAPDDGAGASGAATPPRAREAAALEALFPDHLGNLYRVAEGTPPRGLFAITAPAQPFTCAATTYYLGAGASLRVQILDRLRSATMSAAGDLEPAGVGETTGYRVRTTGDGVRGYYLWGRDAGIARGAFLAPGLEWTMAKILVGERFIVEAEGRALMMESTSDYAQMIAGRVAHDIPN